jgi:phage terminase small subunit
VGKLTEKQKRFIDFYIETGNATEAALKAGYSKKTARATGAENLTKPDIGNAVKVKMQAKEDERIASQDEVLRFFSSMMRGEYVEEIPILCGDGYQHIVEKGISAKDRIRAAENLGKRYGIYKADERPVSDNGILPDILGYLKNESAGRQ